MYTFEGKTIREWIEELAKEGNKPFTAALHPGVENVLGIRVPQLRELAKQIAKADWEDYLHDEAYQSEASYFYMEERMLRGMVIGQVKVKDTEAYLQLVSSFVPLINSWSVCDTFDFSGKQRFVDRNKERVWAYLQGWMLSASEYEVRFGVVMAMMHYVDADYIERLLTALSGIHHEGYYAQMAVAWAVQVCYVKQPTPTLALLRSQKLAPWTHNKAIQKICESLRVTPEEKATVRQLKR